MKYLFVIVLLLLVSPYSVLANMYMYYGPYKHSKTYERRHENDYKPSKPKDIKLDGWGNYSTHKDKGVKYETYDKEENQDRDEYESDSEYAPAY